MAGVLHAVELFSAFSLSSTRARIAESNNTYVYVVNNIYVVNTTEVINVFE
jgi:hypothetical protein